MSQCEGQTGRLEATQATPVDGQRSLRRISAVALSKAEPVRSNCLVQQDAASVMSDNEAVTH